MLPWTQLAWHRPVVHLPSFIRSVKIPLGADRAGWKGGAIRQRWLEYRDQAPGGVYVDGDTALDPLDVLAMERAVASDPGAVWTMACRMWGATDDQLIPDIDIENATTKELEQMWWSNRENPGAVWLNDNTLMLYGRKAGEFAHRVIVNDKARWGRMDDDYIDMFGLGCTYLPNALVERVEQVNGWEIVSFPIDDIALSRFCWQEPRISARLVPGREVCHVHWDVDNVEQVKEAQEDASRREHDQTRQVSTGETARFTLFDPHERRGATG